MAQYAALGALPECHLRSALLRAVGQDAGLQSSYLPLAKGALFGRCLMVSFYKHDKDVLAPAWSLREGYGNLLGLRL